MSLLDDLFGPDDLATSVCRCGHSKSQHNTTWKTTGGCWSYRCGCSVYSGPEPSAPVTLREVS